jgi:hypothetical protein
MEDGMAGKSDDLSLPTIVLTMQLLLMPNEYE